MRSINWKSPLALFLAAFIWGTAFVAQSVGTEYIGAFTFVCIRNLIGSAVLVPCIFLLQKLYGGKQGEVSEEQKRVDRRNLVTGGICCGVVLFIASTLQQAGIEQTSVGKAGFITAMYIVIVPLFGIFLKKRIGIRVWVSVAMAVVGLYLLTMTESLRLQTGDALVLLCALGYTCHILVIDYFSPLTDGVKMSCIQFLTCGILAFFGMLFEHPSLANVLAAAVPLLYAGVMSSGVAYTLQIIGQKNMNPTLASLIMSLESVIAAISGAVILHQSMTGREVIGCIVMFAAIILSQLPQKDAG